MKIAYVNKRFRAEAQFLIATANQIIAEYRAQGFDLTLRQLYYQFVARDLIPNRQSEYKRLGGVISDARLAGLIDWDAIVDRTRNLKKNNHWKTPADILRASARGYREDRWATQPFRPEVWIEKDALIGVIEPVCRRLDVPFFSCRGYTSQSEMWGASQRLIAATDAGQTPMIFHLGDHDPSGIDMTRDIAERLTLFTWGNIEVDRLALNFDQVEDFNPPPNPTKLTDSRAQGYIVEYGSESWELDALEPTVLGGLIETAITRILDDDLWDEAVEKEQEGRDRLFEVAENWS